MNHTRYTATHSCTMMRCVAGREWFDYVDTGADLVERKLI